MVLVEIMEKEKKGEMPKIEGLHDDATAGEVWEIAQTTLKSIQVMGKTVALMVTKENL